MSTRIRLLVPLALLVLGGCVDRGGWRPAPQLAPEALSAGDTLADARVDASA